MKISQRKLDLAVLYKMFEDANRDGGWVTRHDIKQMFSITIPMRRIEAATEKLLADGEIIRDYDPLNLEESRWQLSRLGIEVVERALKVKNSFIFRLSENSDTWLEGPEAIGAKLSKRTRAGSSTSFPAENTASNSGELATSSSDVIINNNFSLRSTNAVEAKSLAANGNGSSSLASWLQVILAVVFGIASIAVTLWLAGKI